jgi:hypothetical protein
MPTTSTRFTHEKAPCGQFVDGERFQDQDPEQDGQCLVTDEAFYACGCESIRNEYHDGTVAMKVIRHDGHILVDELEGGS